MGDKYERPCQIVCGSQCFWTFNTFGLVCANSHELQTGEGEKLLLCGPLLHDVLSPIFQDGRPENDITRASISSGKAEKFQLFPPD